MHQFVWLFCFLAAFCKADFNVKDYGAKGDGHTKDTDAIRKAFEACGRAGGGTVLFPQPGIYLTGAFNISSNTTMMIEENAAVLGSMDNKDYPLIQPLPWYGGGSDYQGSGDLIYQSLLHSWGASFIRITGSGIIDGQGSPWWNCWRHDRKASPCNGISRPHLINLIGGDNIQISDITIRNSPSWTLHLSNLSNVHVANITIKNPSDAPNADGIDVDCSRDVLVEASTLDVGDDALCVKSGKDWFGRTFGYPSTNVTFRNNVVYRGHGVTIGSETSAGVRDVTFENIVMEGTANGIRMKSERGRGGLVRGVVYRNVSMKGVGTCVFVTLNYQSDLPKTNATATPRFDDILIEGLVAEDCGVGFSLDGLPESVIEGLKFVNVDVKAKKMMEKCDYVDGSCTHCSYCPPCIH